MTGVAGASGEETADRGEETADRGEETVDRGEETVDGGEEILDCRGKRCPLPVIALARRLPTLPVGTVLRVLADDPAAAGDIAAWCRLRDQEYLGSPQSNTYRIRRRQ